MAEVATAPVVRRPNDKSIAEGGGANEAVDGGATTAGRFAVVNCHGKAVNVPQTESSSVSVPDVGGKLADAKAKPGDKSSEGEEDEVDDNCKGAAAFLTKLYDILQDSRYSQYVTWSNEGQSIHIKQVEEFSKIVLPDHFKHANFQSFVRQLNMYAFTKTKHDPNLREFHQPLFQRGKKHLLKLIKRKTADKSINMTKQARSQIDDISAELDHMRQEMAQAKNRMAVLEAHLWMTNDRCNQLQMENKHLYKIYQGIRPSPGGGDEFTESSMKAPATAATAAATAAAAAAAAATATAASAGKRTATAKGAADAHPTASAGSTAVSRGASAEDKQQLGTHRSRHSGLPATASSGQFASGITTGPSGKPGPGVVNPTTMYLEHASHLHAQHHVGMHQSLLSHQPPPHAYEPVAFDYREMRGMRGPSATSRPMVLQAPMTTQNNVQMPLPAGYPLQTVNAQHWPQTAPRVAQDRARDAEADQMTHEDVMPTAPQTKSVEAVNVNKPVDPASEAASRVAEAEADAAKGRLRPADDTSPKGKTGGAKKRTRII